MSAATAASVSRRELPKLPKTATTGDPVPKSMKDWSPWLNSVIEFLPVIAKPGDIRVYTLLHRCTVGAEHRPEYCRWTQEDIAAHLHVSINTVAASLDRLCAIYGVIRQKRVGRCNWFGPVIDQDLRPRLRALYEQHQPRTLDRDDDSAEPAETIEVPVPAAETLVILDGSREARPLPEVAAEVQEEMKRRTLIEINGVTPEMPTTNWGNHSPSVPPSKAVLPPAGEPVTIRAAIGQAEIRSELDEPIILHTCVQDGVLTVALRHIEKLAAIEQDHLRVRLNRLLDAELGPIDQKILNCVSAALGGAPSTLLEARIRVRSQMFTSARHRSWGGVVTLAKEVRTAWRQGRQSERAIQAAQHAQRRGANIEALRSMLHDHPDDQHAGQWRQQLADLCGDASP